MTRKDQQIYAEMARRKVQFHSSENWENIRLWGLFSWGFVSHMIKDKRLLTDMAKENKTIWVRPSAETWHTHIKSLVEIFTLDELQKMAGW